MTTVFKSVMIANRGEIALRIARTCRELGISTVLIHSTVDRDSVPARFVDQTVQVGPTAARHSYLSMPAIIEAALSRGVDAIHPGYGFLSEDADFAEVCHRHGLTFVGPPPDVMHQLADKSVARALMAKVGLPVLPGSEEPVASPAEALEIADGIGYPVMLKAAAGGGGRGMKVVHDRRLMPRAFQECRASAQAVFGDGRVYVEQYLESARHVEIQVLCDAHGHGVHLGERDCSVQRRHQKLVEEAPAPGLAAGHAERMGRDAVEGALAIGFVGAGTWEFLVDPDGNHYFMEINGRIQVEHPVTEMITGLDLVREQLRVAAGAPLGFAQDDVVRRGAAIECRVNAEDPRRGFAPTPGLLTRFDVPGGPFTRVDTHCRAGVTIPPDYDPLLAKLVVWAPDRDQALARMDRALYEFVVDGEGVATTIDVLREVMAHPRFRRARHSTRFLEEMTG